MVRLCKCGNFKTVQPYKSTAQFPWICERCKAPKNVVPHVVQTLKLNVTLAAFILKHRKAV